MGWSNLAPRDAVDPSLFDELVAQTEIVRSNHELCALRERLLARNQSALETEEFTILLVSFG